MNCNPKKNTRLNFQVFFLSELKAIWFAGSAAISVFSFATPRSSSGKLETTQGLITLVNKIFFKCQKYFNNLRVF